VNESTSARAALEFMRAGIPNVKTMLGGWDAWLESGGKVQKGRGGVRD
jgi:3-mercaptopyruvate sulfurtransferase SseA